MTIDTEIESKSGDGIGLVNTNQKALIHIVCHGCDEVDKMQIVDNPQESERVKEVTQNYSSIMERHADQTGHFVQLGMSEGSEIDLVDIARALSSKLSCRDD